MRAQTIITGASGFLGQSLVEAAGDGVIPLVGPGHGGLDLVGATIDQLNEVVHLVDPENTLLIHAAADLSDTVDGMSATAMMAETVAIWARHMEIGFSVLVSSATVYPPFPWIYAGMPTGPTTLYGLGKLAAELVWSHALPEDRYSIARMTGLLGWRGRGFLNRLLRAAALSDTPLLVHNRESKRNYFSGKTAARLLMRIGKERMAGTWLGAGLDILTAEQYVAALQALPDSRLRVVWGSGFPDDTVIFHPSGILLPQLRPLKDELDELWKERPM